jgi:hypothetical protein
LLRRARLYRSCSGIEGRGGEEEEEREEEGEEEEEEEDEEEIIHLQACLYVNGSCCVLLDQ